jgi:hypothetical protein
VLISYDVYRRIQALLERLREDPEQGYFWSDEWQDRIQEGEIDIQTGRTIQVTGDNVEQALEWLDEYGWVQSGKQIAENETVHPSTQPQACRSSAPCPALE